MMPAELWAWMAEEEKEKKMKLVKVIYAYNMKTDRIDVIEISEDGPFKSQRQRLTYTSAAWNERLIEYRHMEPIPVLMTAMEAVGL